MDAPETKLYGYIVEQSKEENNFENKKEEQYSYIKITRTFYPYRSELYLEKEKNSFQRKYFEYMGGLDHQQILAFVKNQGIDTQNIIEIEIYEETYSRRRHKLLKQD
jgi:hypothetical protein